MRPTNKLVTMLNEMADAENQDDFCTVSYRALPKTATMIDIMAIILKQPASTLFTSSISEKLVEVILANERNMPLLETFLADKDFEKDKQPSGFIKILERQGVLRNDRFERLWEAATIAAEERKRNGLIKQDTLKT
jgi:hypothetical protein